MLSRWEDCPLGYNCWKDIRGRESRWDDKGCGCCKLGERGFGPDGWEKWKGACPDDLSNQNTDLFVVFLAWLGAFCIPSEVATNFLVRSLLVPTQGPGPCLGIGNLVPALAPSEGTGRLTRGVNIIAPWIGYIPTLDRGAPKQRLSTIDRMPLITTTQVPTPAIFLTVWSVPS